MVMDNGRISLRQYRRLLFFDMVGIGLVLLPDLLARNARRAGGFAILLGAMLACVYTKMLLSLKGEKKRSWIFVPYGIYWLLLGAYGLYLLADLILTFLLPEESAGLIAGMILLLVLYSRHAGLEGRGRAFEVLFLPMILLLILLFLLGCSGIRVWNLLPLQIVWDGFDLWGWYPAFLVFGSSQLSVFMKDAMGEKTDREKLWKSTCLSVGLAAAVLFFCYEMLLGSFGDEALGAAKMPLMIFTSNLILPGGFFRRQEALVAGVCFAGLVAFCGSGLHYGIYCMKQGMHRDKKWMDGLFSLCMFFLALWQYYYGSATEGLPRWIAWVSPVAMLLPFLLTYSGKKKGKKAAFGGIIACLLFCSGCGVQELEDKSFPMLMAMKEQQGDCVLIYKYMDLSRVSEKEKTRQGSDKLSAESSTVAGAIRRMDEKNGKVLDLNHVKVLLLEEGFIENEELMEQLVEKGNSGTELPGNMLVFVTEDVDALSDLQGDMDEDLGNYLSEMMEGNPNYRDTEASSFKSLICDWYHGAGNTILPSLGVEEGLPVVDGYYVIQTGTGGRAMSLTKVTEAEGCVAGLCSGAVGTVDMDVDEGQIHVENVKVSYEYTGENDGIWCRVHLKGDIMKRESGDLPAELIRTRADEYLTGMISNGRKRGVDLCNSYGHLRCHDKDLWLCYEGARERYDRDLTLEVDCDFRVIE